MFYGVEEEFITLLFTFFSPLCNFTQNVTTLKATISNLVFLESLIYRCILYINIYIVLATKFLSGATREELCQLPQMPVLARKFLSETTGEVCCQYFRFAVTFPTLQVPMFILCS